MHIEDYLNQLNRGLEDYFAAHNCNVFFTIIWCKKRNNVKIVVVYVDSIDLVLKTFFELGFSIYNRQICVNYTYNESVHVDDKELMFNLTIEETYKLLALMKLKGY